MKQALFAVRSIFMKRPFVAIGITEAIKFAMREVGKGHDVRITDKDGTLVIHIVNKEVIYPKKDSIFPHILQLLCGLEVV